MMPQPSMLILLVVTSAMTLMPASAQDGPMQTASPAISDKVSSFERAARVNNAGFSSTATGRDVNSFDPAAATLAWLDSVPRNQREKSDAYFEGGYWLILWNFLMAAAISIFLLASRISAWLRDFAERVCTGSRWLSLQVILYEIPYFFIAVTLSFPLHLYENFFREHHYGFATQSFLPWFRDQLTGLDVAIVAGTILLVVLYAVFRRVPRTWWIWGTAVA